MFTIDTKYTLQMYVTYRADPSIKHMNHVIEPQFNLGTNLWAIPIFTEFS